MPRIVRLRRRFGRTFLLLHPTMVVRRSVFDLLGGFDGSTRIGADTDFVLRATHIARVSNLRQFLYVKRIRSGALTTSGDTGFGSARREEYLRLLRDREREWRYLAHQPAQLLEALRATPSDMTFEIQRVEP
jgi:hypothetical protein